MNAGKFVNCSLQPAGAQDGTCDQSWEPLPPLDPNGHVALTHSISANFQPVTGDPIQQAIAAAAAGKIPQCVLEGVGYIEGAYNQTYLVDENGKYNANGSCGPNECSAVGPFQITTGVGPASDPNCTTCGAGHCPNSLPSGIDPCNTDSAAKGAVILLMAKAAYFGTPLSTAAPSSQMLAIRNAGDSYYGSTSPLPLLGGLSYGEFLYAHCVGGSIPHVPHSFPSKGG